MNIQDNIEKIVSRLVKDINPEKIILFGSYAREEASYDSDLDLLIIEKEPFNKKRNKWRELIRIREALADYRIAKDILVFSEDEVDYWKAAKNHIISIALNEGKVLYDRYRT